MADVAKIIKYEGDNTTFVWKSTCTDFTTTSQLIVHESQEAVFFVNGQAADLFGPGLHTLKTANLPLLQRLITIPTDGKTPFHCEVYFINKTEQMNIKWGTDSKVQYMEPKYGFPISIGASGEMALRVEDSRKLLVKLIGTETMLGQNKLSMMFRAFLMTKVKTYIAKVIKEKAISIFELDEQLADFSAALHGLLIPDFLDYGVKLERFFVTNVLKPDGEKQYERFKDLHFRQFADVAEAKLDQQVDLIKAQTRAQETIIESQAIATKRAQEGYTYSQERGFDVAEKVAQNEAVGQFTNMGVGLGTMAGVGGAVGGMVGGMMNEAMGTAVPNVPVAPVTAVAGASVTADTAFCDNCGTPLAPDAAFCDECGTPVVKADVCGQCGFAFERPGKFCPKCGAKR